jgi:hypothetical protein
MHDKAPDATAADPYAAEGIAQLVEAAGINKSGMPALATVILAILGGAFIAFGAMSYTVVLTGSALGFGPTRLVAGIAFSVGLVLVIVAGAELFTGSEICRQTALRVLALANGYEDYVTLVALNRFEGGGRIIPMRAGAIIGHTGCDDV